MRIMSRTSVAVASLVASLFVAGNVAAQSDGMPPEPRARPEAGEPAPDAGKRAPETDGAPAPQTDGPPPPDARNTPPPSPRDKAAMKAHMDELFRRLADPEAEDWQRVQAQIIQAWNRSGSASMDLLAARADKAMKKRDLDTALLHLNDLVRLAPDYAEGWNKRATVHFMKEDYGPSLEDIARVLRLEPRHFGALSGLGIILDRVGDSEGALEAYRRAIAIHPNLPGVKDGIKKLEKQVEGERL